MKYSYLKNNRGLTLVELIVALGLSTMLLIFVVSGSLFVQDFLKERERKDKITEELAFIGDELSKSVLVGREISLYPDSLVVTSPTNETTAYSWNDGQLYENGLGLLGVGLHLDTISVSEISLPQDTNLTIFNWTRQDAPSGLYELYLVVSDQRNSIDSIRSILRNEHTIIKYAPH